MIQNSSVYVIKIKNIKFWVEFKMIWLDLVEFYFSRCFVISCCGNSVRLFFWAPKSLQMVTVAMKLKDAYSLQESYEQPRWHIKKQRHYFANKGLSSQSYGFSSSHVWIWQIKKAEFEELVLLNYGVGEDSWKSLGLQGDLTSPS